MFGLDFLFAAALFALPLAGVPILLHLLFRKKSPVVEFSTLRFIKASIQKTAARRRINKWLLLTCRVLLLALLIWAIAQPAKMLAGNFFTGNSVIAAIVVDTSYSSQLIDAQTTQLEKSDAVVQDLLRNQLKDARVAIFQSLQNREPEKLDSASALLAQWRPLKPQPNPKPLIDRIAAANEFLKKQDANQKWLVVLTDNQSREFPRPMPELSDAHLIWFDLHPGEPRSAGITNIAIKPEQPIPGVGSEAVIDVIGRSGDSRAVSLAITNLAGQSLAQTSPVMANFDSTGQSQIRFPIKLPAERFLLLTASLSGQDALAFDDSRTQLIEIPPRQSVTLLDSNSSTPATRFVKLALDPSEGKLSAWPIELSVQPAPSGKESTIVAIFQSDWPTAALATRLRDFTKSGGSLVIFLQPGLQESWSKLPDDRKKVLLDLLPAAPLQKSGFTVGHATIAAMNDPLLAGLTDDKFQLTTISVRGFVPLFPIDPAVTTILNVASSNPDNTAKPLGLLFRKRLAAGTIYTWAIAPDPSFTNLATRPIFLPLIVREALRPQNASAAQNVELGQPLTLTNVNARNLKQVQIESPQREIYVVDPTDDSAGKRFEFDRATTPGLYTWRNPADNSTLAITNVQFPAGESDLTYRPAENLTATAINPIVVKSLAELQTKFTNLTEPEAHWTTPIAIVLLLLIFESLIASGGNIWTRKSKASPTSPIAA